MPLRLRSAGGGSVLLKPPVAQAADVSMEVPAYDGAKLLTNKTPGCVLQVIQGIATSQVTVGTNTYTDIGLSATITPLSATSKILVLANVSAYVSGNGNGYGLRLLREAIEVWNPSPQDGTGPFYCYSGAGGGVWDNSKLEYLDSPGSAGALTYKIQGRPYSSAIAGAIFNHIGNVVQGKSSLILMEIAA